MRALIILIILLAGFFSNQDQDFAVCDGSYTFVDVSEPWFYDWHFDIERVAIKSGNQCFWFYDDSTDADRCYQVKGLGTSQIEVRVNPEIACSEILQVEFYDQHLFFMPGITK